MWEWLQLDIMFTFWITAVCVRRNLPWRTLLYDHQAILWKVPEALGCQSCKHNTEESFSNVVSLEKYNAFSLNLNR